MSRTDASRAGSMQSFMFEKSLIYFHFFLSTHLKIYSFIVFQTAHKEIHEKQINLQAKTLSERVEPIGRMSNGTKTRNKNSNYLRSLRFPFIKIFVQIN